MNLGLRAGMKARSSFLPVLFLVILLFVVLIPQNVQAENTDPTLTNGTVTPRKSYPNIDYTFTVTYTDSNNDIPSSVKVIIDDEEYEMGEIDSSDDNYTDGKEYSFKKVMGEGSYTIYYSANDGNGSVVNSDPFTLSVTWDVGHYDIIHFLEEDVFPGLLLLLAIIFILMLIFCIISIYMVMQLRKIAKGLEGKVDKEEEREERDSGGEGEEKDK
ncbi:MAG: hypothetical protein JSW00_03775 [Thermoplasmata archaeon]|nr:MAG: hypothetical protein JSW00_03775 [Thermoplasmata archaeon]